MTQVNVSEAKTHFSRLLARVAGGEEIVIAKRGKPVARLVPCAQRNQDRIPGRERGRFRIAEDFDAPLPEELQRAFEE